MSIVLRSSQDASVNFVRPADLGLVEARYVRRAEDYFIVYLSSQTGCRKACRMCHLTQTGQTRSRDLTVDEILGQADEVLTWYGKNAAAARVVHFNFMARGEPLSNPHVLEQGDALLGRLTAMAVGLGLIPRIKISTIMPAELRGITHLTSVFPSHSPDLYYSLYSVDPAFRRRWLPKAEPPQEALVKLAAYQRDTRKIPVLHWAFIEGENDGAETVEGICAAVRASGLRADVNIVRYNPHSPDEGREPSPEVIERNRELLVRGLPGARVKVVSRVGFDVKASCGMFVAAGTAEPPAASPPARG